MYRGQGRWLSGQRYSLHNYEGLRISSTYTKNSARCGHLCPCSFGVAVDGDSKLTGVWWSAIPNQKTKQGKKQ